MPTGPFKAMGQWQVHGATGGPSCKVTIVRATKKWIKYTLKDHSGARRAAARASAAARLRHGKVHRWPGPRELYHVYISDSQYIEQDGPYEEWRIAWVQQRARRTMAAWRIWRFLRDTTCNPVYAAARRSLERLCQS